MLWLNGTRGHGRVALRVGPTEYWAFTSDPTEVAIRDAAIAKHARQRLGGDRRAGPSRHARAPRRSGHDDARRRAAQTEREAA